MKDRNVTFPFRFIDQAGNYLSLTPAPGIVIEEGSLYNKANVLPDSVCQALGLEPDPAEPKDAFQAVASGRYYGKISQLTGNDGIFPNDDNNDSIVRLCQFTSAPFNDYGDLVKDEGVNYYTKIPIPSGAKRIRFTATGRALRQTFGAASVRLLKNGTTEVATLFTATSDSGNASTTTKSLDVTGDGTEYFQIRLYGENSKDNDSKGQAECSMFQMEVTA